jgi:hypothetical protein
MLLKLFENWATASIATFYLWNYADTKHLNLWQQNLLQIDT